MATEIILPFMGEAITEATLASWLKQVGHEVKRGEVLAEVETDKAVMPLECPVNGVLLAVLVEKGSKATRGQLLAVVGQPGEKWQGRQEVEAERVPPEIKRPVDSEALGQIEATERRRVSPSARRMAQQLGVNIDEVQPEVPGARVITEDVERYAATIKAREQMAPARPSHRVTLSSVRKIVAERMTESARSIPQFSITTEANASRMLAVQQELSRQVEQAGVHVSLTALLVYLTARALARHPLLNAQFDGDGIIVYDTLNIAVAVATPSGLTAPVLHGAENLSVLDIARRLTKVSAAARDGRLSLADVVDATFTISNLGMFGVTQFIPLVNPPQAAILGVGTARPAILPSAEEKIRQVQLMSLTVSADHRVLDGEEVARFLATLGNEIKKCEVEHINIIGACNDERAS
jgi:pyruvate dehydrogenase E2 component (dihydrolipoamide acetyltransferase)